MIGGHDYAPIGWESNLSYSNLTSYFLSSWSSQYKSNLKKPHLDTVRRILGYVKGTINFCIVYKKTKNYK